MKVYYFFSQFFWFILALLDPDPDSESGSTDLIASGPEPLFLGAGSGSRRFRSMRRYPCTIRITSIELLPLEAESVEGVSLLVVSLQQAQVRLPLVPNHLGAEI
jgi:hypothetical protein